MASEPQGTSDSLVQLLESTVSNFPACDLLAQALGAPDEHHPLSDPLTGRESRQLASPVRLSAAPPRYRQIPPALGEHQGARFAPEFSSTTRKAPDV